MTLETLTNCSCLRKLEKDMISESLQVNLQVKHKEQLKLS
jgi:hypothetical protein